MVYSINGNFGGFQIITVSFDARSSDLIKALCRVYEGQHGLAKCLEGRGAVNVLSMCGKPSRDVCANGHDNVSSCKNYMSIYYPFDYL